MASQGYGARHNLPGFDQLKTGLTFGEVRQMLWSADPDPSTWRRKSRGCVLGLWHRLKLEMYQELMAGRESEAA